MSNELKKYVQECLLHPASSFNVDEDVGEENGQVVEELINEERASSNLETKSRLRAQNASLLSVLDPRYKGKKISRSNLKKDVEVDSELLSLVDFDDKILFEDDESDSVSTETRKKPSRSLLRIDDDDLQDEGIDQENDSEEENDANDLMESDGLRDSGDEEGFRLGTDTDFSSFAYDFDEEEEEEESSKDSEEGEAEEEEQNEKDVKSVAKKKPKDVIKKFSAVDDQEDIQKGQSVKNQLALYDSLFEVRIGMQKGMAGINQLPQFNTFKDFLKKKDTNYLKNLSSTKLATKKLLNSLLELQKILLRENPETASIFTSENDTAEGESGDEMDDKEDEDAEKGEVVVKRSSKRKLSLEEYENILNKRHAALTPFRNETINRWYEKTKLLSKSRGLNKFGGFEVSALQQLENVLNNKMQLIRRTQLTGVTRGTSYHKLGQCDTNANGEEAESFDPEIFDDGDFYSRALEEMVKSKISFSDDMMDVSKKWIEIQKLRKKAKRKVDTRASKGRKLKYEVITKLQQFLAPCKPPIMDDSAVNTLFASVFDGRMSNANKVVNL